MELNIRLLSENDFFKVDSFDCGVENEPLTNYLKNNAFKEHKSGKSKIYIIENIQDESIIGYFSLRTSGLGFVSAENQIVNFVPAVELSEFALDISYQRKGLGTNLFLGYIVPKIQELSESVGCQIILVYAFHQNAINFYRKNNFVELEGAQEFLTIMDNFSDGCRVFVYTLQDNFFDEIQINTTQN